MWQYQNTDELYHASMYKNMNKKLNHELYHSDIYLGKDYSDGIKHWKYIKREKVNGRWRYYYKDSADKKLQKARTDRQEAVDIMRSANRAISNRDIGVYEPEIHYPSGRYTEGEKAYKFIGNNLKEKEAALNKAENKNFNRKRKYEKYLINPMNKVSDAAYNTKQKVNKAKEKIKQKIGIAINKIKSRKTKGKA